MTDRVVDRCREQLAVLNDQNRLRRPRIVDVRADGRCSVAGKVAVNFGGNDYLNLAHEVGTLVLRQAETRQVGATASAIVAGRSSHHAALESALADFEQTEAALLFPSGFAANLGVLGTLVETGDAIFCDRDNHASIIDAAQASDGKLQVYRRDRLDALRQALQRRRTDFQEVFVVTDGVFSMDGEVAPLGQLCDIAQEFDAAVIVDEAHGTGVLGSAGRGACDVAGVEERALLRVGTLSKALGGLGGFVVGQQPVIDLLRNRARTQFYSTALPPFICQAMLQALRVVREEPVRRQQLADLTRYARSRMAELGLTTVGNGTAPIVPILLADEAEAIRVAREVLAAGFFVPAIRPPTVPHGTSRLRMSLTCAHSKNDLENALRLIAKAAKT